MRLLRFSYCRFCGAPIEYGGRGRPREICDECREIQKDRRRLYMLKYMDKYREKRRIMFLE